MATVVKREVTCIESTVVAHKAMEIDTADEGT